MVKVYYEYQFFRCVGQSISKSSNFVYDSQRALFVAGVNQYVTIISAKTGQVLKYLHKPNKNVPIRYIKVHNQRIFGGYEDGEIVVWNSESFEQESSFDFHKKTISSICIYEEEQKMVSASMDGSIIIWDLLSEECEKIKSAHTNTITQMEVVSLLYRGKPTPVIISIGKDGFLKVWSLKDRLCLSAISCHATQALSLYVDRHYGIIYVGTNKEDIVEIEVMANKDQNDGEICRVKGIFKRKGYSRCMQIQVQGSTLQILNSEKGIESYQMLSHKEAEQRKKRAIGRKKKKEGNSKQQQQQKEDVPHESEDNQYSLKYIEEKVIPFKVYNFQVYGSKIFVNNGTNIYEVGPGKELTNGLGRTNQLSLEYPFMVQRSPSSLNIYNQSNFNKLFTIPIKANCCSLFNNGFIVIVQSNCVSIWDLSKNEQIYRLQEKWMGCWARKNRCLVWRENEIGFFQIGYNKQKQIKMKEEGSRCFEDKVTCASYKEGMDKYIVCLQNSQILIQYSDSHKNFLKLYGHKMPILSYDLSSDNNLLATGSIDKDIRLWDMDFGHSIKTIFAHQEAITVVKFIHETHYLLSGSRDGHIKYWDADSFQLVMDFEESLLQVKSIVVTNGGDYIIGGGLDQGFRVWKQTNNQTIAGDIEEKQQQKIMIEDYAKEKMEKNEEKTRYEDLKHGQQIIQGLQNEESPKTIIGMLKRIPPANLKSSLSFLHKVHLVRLQKYLELMIGNEFEIETCWRVMHALDRGSGLSGMIRQSWKSVGRSLRVNKQGMKMLLKAIEEERSMF